jgi:hypothetical protein
MGLDRFLMRKTSLCRDLTYRSLFNLRSMLVPLLLVLSMTMPNPVQAANPMVTVGTASRPAGNPVDLDISFAPGSTAVSTMTIDLSLPLALSYISTATGAAANAAGKTAQGNAIPGGAHGLRCGRLVTLIMAILCVTVCFWPTRRVMWFVHDISLCCALCADMLKIAVAIGRKRHARKVAWRKLSAKSRVLPCLIGAEPL